MRHQQHNKHEALERRATSKVLTVKETADALTVSTFTIYGLMRTGQLKSFTIGKRRLIPTAAVDAFIETRLASGDA